jgi:hypothetical protein
VKHLIESLHQRYMRRYGEDPVAVYAALIAVALISFTIGVNL